METCSHCRFFRDELSECRRNAPVPAGHRQIAQWPKVKVNDGCGEFISAAATVTDDEKRSSYTLVASK